MVTHTKRKPSLPLSECEMCSGCPGGQLSEIIILLLCSWFLPWNCFSCYMYVCVSVFVRTQHTDKHVVMCLVILLYRTLVRTQFVTHCIRYVEILSNKMCRNSLLKVAACTYSLPDIAGLMHVPKTIYQSRSYLDKFIDSS